MKRVKIMLMSFALLAVVAGALAFKAKFVSDYCTTTAVQNAQGQFTCPAGNLCTTTPMLSRQEATIGGTLFCTTPVPAGGNCRQVQCPNRKFIESDQ